MKVYIETYGCQMNVNDSEVVLSILADAGYERCEAMSEADLILANTCSIRENAEQRVYGRIDVFRLEKKKRPGVVVGILGCMAERRKAKLLAGRSGALGAGPDAYRSLPQMVADVHPGAPQVNVELSRTETYDDITPLRTDRNGVSAYISIMRGCNNCCSYCVVPYTRGAERSRDPYTIVEEAKDVFAKGYKEVSLLGQNVDSYLWKAPEDCPEHAGETVNFARLLEMVAQIDPRLRVRFSTSYPSDITDELLYTMARYGNVCKHIHFPVQSGSNAMLEKMRRKYTREWYLSRIDRIREIVPGCGITTDVIAGFSGESEQDHRDTLSLFELVKFDAAFMFAYSERPGTLAARKYPDDVPQSVKTERLNQIIERQGRMGFLRYKEQIGKTVEVLVEGPSKKNPDELCGRAGNYMMCVWPDKEHKAGDYVEVKVVDATPATLICVLA